MEGIFHNISEKMRVSLVKMRIEDDPEAHATDRLDLSKQRSTKRRKEEFLRDKTVLAVSEGYIDAFYYN